MREDTQFETFLAGPHGDFTLATLFALPTLGQAAPSVASLLGYPFVSLPVSQALCDLPGFSLPQGFTDSPDR